MSKYHILHESLANICINKAHSFILYSPGNKNVLLMLSIINSLATLNYKEYSAHNITILNTINIMMSHIKAVVLNHILLKKHENADSGDKENMIFYFSTFAKYLWSLSVFQHYDKDLINNLLSFLKSVNQYLIGDEVIYQMSQSMVWIHSEVKEGLELHPEFLLFLSKNKEKYKNMITLHDPPEVIKLKDMIRKELLQSGREFCEEFDEYPYVIDFADKKNKVGIIVESDDMFIDTGGKYFISGMQSLRNRQLLNYGWKIKNISFDDWILSDNKELFNV